MITELKENEVFVFGSNLAGIHGAGAARQAYKQFGAALGVGEGLTGQCYAFPTLGPKLEKIPIERMEEARDSLYSCCAELPEKTFLLTKVGCGLAGYDELEMRALFTRPPKNLIVPEGWEMAG